MATTEDFKARVSRGESETQEFKATTGQRTDVAKTVCAMLNNKGGQVLIGVDPKAQIRGQDVTDKTIEDLTQVLQQIEPPAFPTLDRVPLETGKEVIIVSVDPGRQRPYRYQRKAYRRVGNSNLEMSDAESERMFLERIHATTRWETEIADGWSIDDLDTKQLILTVEEAIRRGRLQDPGTRNPQELLTGLGLLARDGKLLRAAVVLFGKAERFLPDYVQCLLRLARFKGTEKTEFIDNRQFHGNAFELLAHADRFLREHLPVAGRIVPDLFERVDDPLYPPVALREALANAICHRDYGDGGGSIGIAIFDDRLEITSAGVLHFGLKPEDLFRPHESKPWNPLIASVFYRRGIIEAWGRGTLKMVEVSERAGLPKPEIEELQGAVLVRFRPSGYVPPLRIGHNLTPRQQRILGILGGGGHLAISKIVELLGEPIARRTVNEDLSLLRSLGLIESASRGRGARWFLKGRSGNKAE